MVLNGSKAEYVLLRQNFLIQSALWRLHIPRSHVSSIKFAPIGSAQRPFRRSRCIATIRRNSRALGGNLIGCSAIILCFQLSKDGPQFCSMETASKQRDYRFKLVLTSFPISLQETIECF